jgi:hypothetical protein
MRLCRQGMTNTGAALALLAITALLLQWPTRAEAERTSMYEPFAGCPTGAPLMNEAANEVAACFLTVVRAGRIKVGSTEMAIQSPMEIKFAVWGTEKEEVETEEGGTEVKDSGIVKVLPGSTTLRQEPFLIHNPIPALEEIFGPEPETPAVAPAVPAAPAAAAPIRRKKHRHKKRRKACHRRHCKRCQKPRCKHRQKKGKASASASDDPQIAISIELLGDLRNLNLNEIFNEPEGPVFELPFRLHLRGEGLGPECFIGSSVTPIVLAPEQAHAGSVITFGSDPNGFRTQLLGISGARLEDKVLTVPTADGCGPPSKSSGEASFDEVINETIGLPAASGSSRAVLADTSVVFAEAGYDESEPNGGAELQAAFEAAQEEVP